MKIMAVVSIVTLFSLAACEKPSTELSQRERELSETLKENEIIVDGAIRLKLDYQNAQIELDGTFLSVTQPYVNYYIESMPENSETVLYIDYKSGTGTFDLMAEGFTASTNTKRFYLLGTPIGTGKTAFMKITKGVVKYTFVIL